MANSIPPGFNRALYGMFLLLAVYQCWTHADYTRAASSVGIALVFDPFNQQQPWNQPATGLAEGLARGAPGSGGRTVWTGLGIGRPVIGRRLSVPGDQA
jgi:hypothetical protein